MEEDKPNEGSDVEKEIDDDGDRPLREISGRSTLMKDRTMSVDSEASEYTQNSISSVASLSSPATKASSRPAPLNPHHSVYPASSNSSSMAYTPVCAKEPPMSDMCILVFYLTFE